MASKAKVKNEKPVIYDVLDEMLDLPEEYVHLCAALADDENIKPLEGQMRFLINRDVMDVMRDVVDELEMSRGIPVNVRNILIADPVVTYILQHEKGLKAPEAIDKAVAWYERQKNQVQTDALFIAFTMYNEFNIAPTPYKEGELAFSPTKTEDHRRSIPAWMKNGGREVSIPLPERNLMNKYELRLKQLFDIANMCGAIWVNGLMAKINEGMAKTIRLLDPVDDAGFPSESSG